jgi:ankyrin repeat-rich membrane spanning protein
VTLEEQMICGALQTLNEEACEDVMEETEEEVEAPYKVTSSAPPTELGESSVIINLRTRSGDKDENVLGDIHKIEDFI